MDAPEKRDTPAVERYVEELKRLRITRSEIRELHRKYPDDTFANGSNGCKNTDFQY